MRFIALNGRRIPPNRGNIVQKFKTWNEKFDFIRTQVKVCHHELKSIESIVTSTIPKLLQIIDAKNENCMSDAIIKSVKRFIEHLCNEISCYLGHCIQIYTGSFTENTRCFYVDEFDVLLYFKNDFLKDRQTFLLHEQVLNALLQFKERVPQIDGLIISDARILASGKYPCLKVPWISLNAGILLISIDLVPVIPFTQPDSSHTTLCFHRYIPVACPTQSSSTRNRGLHKTIELTNDGYLQCMSEKCCTKYVDSPYPKLHGMTSGKKCNFSLFENAVMRSLPDCVRMGYKIAKAIRITNVLEIIANYLAGWGVTFSFDVIVRSYHLKTCILYLTAHHRHSKETCYPWY